MTKKQEFLNFVDALIAATPEDKAFMSDNVREYLNAIRETNINKPELSDNAIMILKFLKENRESKNMWKAKEIGEAIGVNSRVVSGSMRKLVDDGYVEKIGKDPTIYSITEKGLNKEI